jgi:hypothetical protein
MPDSCPLAKGYTGQIVQKNLQISVIVAGETWATLSDIPAQIDPYQNFIRLSTNYQITIDVIDHD